MQLIVIVALVWVLFKFKDLIKRLIPNTENSLWTFRYNGESNNGVDTTFNKYVKLTVAIHHQVIITQPDMVLRVVKNHLDTIRGGIDTEVFSTAKASPTISKAVLSANIDSTAKDILNSFFSEVIAVMTPGESYDTDEFFTSIRHAIA